ncbi:MAG: hypothetical protein M3Q73_02600 [bacterium]|nr:hypothetical protein [bacterium]
MTMEQLEFSDMERSSADNSSVFKAIHKEYLHAHGDVATKLLVRMEGAATSKAELETVDRLIMGDSPLKRRVQFRIQQLEEQDQVA